MQQLIAGLYIMQQLESWLLYHAAAGPFTCIACSSLTIELNSRQQNDRWLVKHVTTWLIMQQLDSCLIQLAAAPQLTIPASVLKMIIQVLKIYYSQHKQDYLWIENLYSWNKNCKVNNFNFFLRSKHKTLDFIHVVWDNIFAVSISANYSPRFTFNANCYQISNWHRLMLPICIYTVKYPPSGVPVSPILETSRLNV